jgi:hypothetical protein
MWNSANLTEGEEVWGEFENRMLIRIFKPKIKWQSILKHNEDFYNLFFNNDH